MKFQIIFFCLAASATANSSWRILGGQNAAEGQFPYQVYIQTEPGRYCGGSILDAYTILCAAHCVYKKDHYKMIVTLGSNKLSEHSEEHRVVRATPHENYTPMNLPNDISIIKLETPIRFRDGVAPMQLPRRNIGVETVTLSGWGKLSYPGSSPDHLQFINLRTITLDDCKKVFGENISDHQVCTLSKAGEGSCTGDSGGPLVDTRGEQIGIVSYGIPCGKGYPDVFTRVYSYLDWIEANR